MCLYRKTKTVVVVFFITIIHSFAQMPRENIAIVFESTGKYNIDLYSQKIISALNNDIDLNKVYAFKVTNARDWKTLKALEDEEEIMNHFEKDNDCHKYVFKFNFSNFQDIKRRINMEACDLRNQSSSLSWKIMYDQDIEDGSIDFHMAHILEYMKIVLLKNNYCNQLSIFLGDPSLCSISKDILSNLHSIRKNHFRYKYYLVRDNRSGADVNIKFDKGSNKIHCNNTEGTLPIYSPPINCTNPTTDHLDKVLNNLVTNIKSKY